jgi:hypothetical protein
MVGERVVPQSYTRAMFEKTQAWMHARNLFDAAPDTGFPTNRRLISELRFVRLCKANH